MSGRRTPEEVSALVHDYADGLLDPGRAAEFERLLDSRPDMQAELEAVRALKATARTLPGNREPRRDLWPGIRDALTPRPEPAPGAPWWRRGWWVPAGLAAAAAAALVVFTWTPSPDGDRAGGGVPAPPSPGAYPAEVLRGMVRGLELECRGAGKEVLASRSADPAGFEESAAGILDGNLSALDRAIAETRSALVAHPGHPELVNMLVKRYRQKLDLLHEATRVARMV